MVVGVVVDVVEVVDVEVVVVEVGVVALGWVLVSVGDVDVDLVDVDVWPVEVGGRLAGCERLLRELFSGAPWSWRARCFVSAGRPVGAFANSLIPPCSVPRSPGWIGR